MLDKLALARHFIETYPEAAAREVEGASAEQTAALIDALPDKESASLLASMLPYHAARCVSQLSPVMAAKYLSLLEPRIVAGILRLVQETAQERIFNKLPRLQAVQVSIILNYSLSMVGAWLSPMVLALPSNCTIGEAKSRLKSESYADFHRVYVVDEHQTLKGFVRLVNLMVADDEAPLKSQLENFSGALSAITSLDMAFEDHRWADADYLPVVDRREKFLGVLRYVDLRAALTRPQSSDGPGDPSDTFLDLAASCYLGLADVMITTLAPGSRERTKDGV